MKLTTRQDVEAPVGAVWAALVDFDGWERAAMRRGAEVNRTDALRAVGPGMAWAARFAFRGQDRNITLRLTAIEQNTLLKLALGSRMFEGTIVIDVVEMSARQTRLHVATEVAPLSLAARLLLQSLKLAKARVQKRYDKRVAQLAMDIEARVGRV